MEVLVSKKVEKLKPLICILISLWSNIRKLKKISKIKIVRIINNHK